MSNKLISSTSLWPVDQLLFPGSYSLWVSSLTSLNGRLWNRAARYNEFFPSKIAFHHSVLSQQQKTNWESKSVSHYCSKLLQRISWERGEDADITQFLLTKGLPNLPDLNSQRSKTSQATIVLIFIKSILWLLHIFI